MISFFSCVKLVKTLAPPFLISGTDYYENRLTSALANYNAGSLPLWYFVTYFAKSIKDKEL